MKTDGQLYLRNVRELGCMLAWTRRCAGIVEAHHAGKRPGVAKKAPDDTAIPLCSTHHIDWHAASGVFRGLDQAARRAWADGAIAMVRERLAPF
jgi:hypothetical protein